MWQRVKGKTESDLMKLPFRQVYNFRPGVIKPTKGLKNILRFINGWAGCCRSSIQFLRKALLH
jgi:hypothetical protein